jgi:hypothetical protein
MQKCIAGVFLNASSFGTIQSASSSWAAGSVGLRHRWEFVTIAPGPTWPGYRMITATVRYKLPPHIDYAACRDHFHKIAPGFREVKGLISKHFICSDNGWAGGVYQWEGIEDAKAFYSGPWLDGIVQRYGMKPQIEFYEVFAVTDNARGKVEFFKETVGAK